MNSLIEQPGSGAAQAEPPPDSIAVLIVDDNDVLVNACGEILSGEGYTVHTAGSGEEALEVVRRHRPDVVLAELKLPDIDGLDLLRRIREDAPDTLVVMITEFATVESSWEAMRAGAYDYVPKPFTATMLRILATRAAGQVKLFRDALRRSERLGEHRGFGTFVAVGEAMREVLARLRRAAPTDASIFVSGECGTGKELAAWSVHANSRRAARPFASIHCAALADHLLEAELFGYEGSSFGRGPQRKPGLLELAGDGTLFLDEIPEMSLELQERLLRAIRERRGVRLGGVADYPIAARLVASSTRDPEVAVREGTLRPDLLHVLGEVRVRLPPLRERREDVPVLAERFLREYAREYGRGDLRFTPEALRVLEGRHWGGNVRELDMMVMLVASRCPPGQEIRAEHLPEEMRQPR